MKHPYTLIVLAHEPAGQRIAVDLSVMQFSDEMHESADQQVYEYVNKARAMARARSAESRDMLDRWRMVAVIGRGELRTPAKVLEHYDECLQAAIERRVIDLSAWKEADGGTQQT